MTLRICLLLVAVCLVAPGCGRHLRMQNFIEMANAQRRTLEDELYSLEYDYRRLERQLEACREGQPEPPPPRPGRRSLRPEQLPPLEDDLEPPQIEIPELFQEPTGPPAAGGQGAGDERRAADAIRLVLDAAGTRVGRFDDGTEGIVLALQARGPDHRVLREPGHITVVALDPDRRGDAARIGRWEVDEHLVAAALEAHPDEPLVLELPWIGSPPDSRRLELVVDYDLADGQQAQARQRVALADSRTLGRWTPRAVPELRMAETKPQPPADRPPPAPIADPAPNGDAPPRIGQRPTWQPFR